jgi:hypothetical protein
LKSPAPQQRLPETGGRFLPLEAPSAVAAGGRPQPQEQLHRAPGGLRPPDGQRPETHGDPPMSKVDARTPADGSPEAAILPPLGKVLRPPAADLPPRGASLPPTAANLPPLAASLPPKAADLRPAAASLPPPGASLPPLAATLPPTGASLPPLPAGRRETPANLVSTGLQKPSAMFFKYLTCVA